MKPGSNKVLLRIDLNLNSLDRIIISFKPKPSADLLLLLRMVFVNSVKRLLCLGSMFYGNVV